MTFQTTSSKSRSVWEFRANKISRVSAEFKKMLIVRNVWLVKCWATEISVYSK